MESPISDKMIVLSKASNIVQFVQGRRLMVLSLFVPNQIMRESRAFGSLSAGFNVGDNQSRFSRFSPRENFNCEKFNGLSDHVVF